MRCGFCGTEFSPEEGKRGCGGCGGGCHSVHCPRCGYKNPIESDVFKKIKKLLTKRDKEQ